MTDTIPEEERQLQEAFHQALLTMDHLRLISAVREDYNPGNWRFGFALADGDVKEGLSFEQTYNLLWSLVSGAREAVLEELRKAQVLREQRGTSRATSSEVRDIVDNLCVQADNLRTSVTQVQILMMLSQAKALLRTSHLLFMLLGRAQRVTEHKEAGL